MAMNGRFVFPLFNSFQKRKMEKLNYIFNSQLTLKKNLNKNQWNNQSVTVVYFHFYLVPLSHLFLFFFI